MQGGLARGNWHGSATTTTHLDWPTTSENPHAHAQTNVP
jgi:hypothetical protein